MAVIIQGSLIIRTKCSISIRLKCAYRRSANCFHRKTRKDKRFKWLRAFHCVKPVRILCFLFLCSRISTDSGGTWPNARKSSYAVEQKIVHIWTLINISIRLKCAYRPRANCFHLKTRKDKIFKWLRAFHCVKPVRISTSTSVAEISRFE